MVHRDALTAAMERIAALERQLADREERVARSEGEARAELELLRREHERERAAWARERERLREQIAQLTRQRDALAKRAGSTPSDERLLFKRCLLAAQKGDQRGALALLRELAVKHPESARLAGLLDRVRCERGHRAESAADAGSGRCACGAALVLRA